MVHPDAIRAADGDPARLRGDAEPSGAGWTYRPEYHLGDPAFSLFDPNGERSAVGLTLTDAQAICRAMNAAPAHRDALSKIANGAEYAYCVAIDKADAENFRVLAEVARASLAPEER